jgi:caspase domain-containing protein
MVASRDIGSPSDEGERAARDTDFALVVGVDDYPRFRPLRGAVTDARRFHSWLCAPDGGGLCPDHARLLVSTADPPTPLQDQIDDELEHLLTAARAIGGGRRLYFHFSGHGAMSPGASREDVALLLAKWSRVRARLALSSEAYIDTLTALGLFDEIAVFLDCCRATAEQVVGLPPTFSRSAAPGVMARAFIGYATEAGQSAFEERDGGHWQGVFTRSLLSILQRTERGIDAIGLKCALEREVAMRGQQAHVLNGLRGGSWFGTQGVLPRLEVRFAGTAGTVVLRNGVNAVVDQHVIDGEPWVLSLAPGLYKLECPAGPPVLIDHGREDVTRVEISPSRGTAYG